jgi:membrane protease YdiL (CAAX protease family)
MIIAANASVGRAWAPHASGIICGLLAGSVFLFGAIDYAAAGSGLHNPPALDIGVMVSGLAAAAIASKPVRDRAARWIPIDPDNPVHSLAMALAVILFGTQVASIAFTDVFASELKAPALSLGDLFTQEVPFLVLGLVGVGLWIRRDLRESASRLGAVIPGWWQVALALAAAGVFYAFSIGSDYLSHQLTPGIAAQVDKTSNHLFGGLETSSIGLIALALVPGVCEELLFRGALQPRLGLWITAVLFTVIHTQYGVSLDAPTILVIAVGLGLIRKYTNTTASCACHVAYNLLTGFAPAGIYQQVGIGLEVALAGVVIYVLWTRRRRRAESPAEVPQEPAVR